MGQCWWCHWGWPKPIREIYDRAISALGGYDAPLHFGPSHVVWEDENWDSAQWCLDHFEEWRVNWNKGRYSDEELEVVRRSLVELAAVPEEFKREPDGYDDENPGCYPPPSHWEMVR